MMAFSVFNERLNKIMDMRAMTGAELARAANTTEASISRYKQGVIELPTTEILIELSKALGVSADYLIGIVDSYIEKDTLNKQQTMLLECLERASSDDIEVIWLILSKYMTAAEKKQFAELNSEQGIG